jgi:cell division protein FtsB
LGFNSFDEFDADDLSFPDADDGHFATLFADPGIPNGEEMDGDEEKKEKATDEKEVESDVHQREKAANDMTELQAKVKRLEAENQELRGEYHDLKDRPMSVDELQNIIVALKLGETKGDFKEGEMGYKLPNDKYYKLMMMSQGGFSSGKEQMEHMLMCSASVNRTGGNYGERSDKDKASEKKNPPKKKKRQRQK